jgi:teichuronic acid biosynthesis glycosyltransferase TuaC
MRVLTVTNMWPTEEWPQFGIFVRRQVEELRSRGVDVDVLFVNGRASGANYARGFPRVWRALARRRYDLVQANYVFSGVIARAQPRVPIVLTHHGIEVLESWQAPLAWAVSRVVDAVTVRSEEMKRRLGLPEAEVIPSGVDLDIFRPLARDEARRRVGLAADGRIVLFVGEPRPEKRVDVIRAAVEILRRDDPRVELVTVVGKHPEEVAWHMAAADVLALASNNEGSPSVVKEAMACALPVVSVPVGDVREIIGGTAGCHLVERDPEAFARGLAAALAFRGRTTGRDAVRHLSWPNVTQRLVAVYERVARGR